MILSSNISWEGKTLCQLWELDFVQYLGKLCLACILFEKEQWHSMILIFPNDWVDGNLCTWLGWAKALSCIVSNWAWQLLCGVSGSSGWWIAYCRRDTLCKEQGYNIAGRSCGSNKSIWENQVGWNQDEFLQHWNGPMTHVFASNCFLSQWNNLGGSPQCTTETFGGTGAWRWWTGTVLGQGQK